jgi:uncharacterized membrane protein
MQFLDFISLVCLALLALSVIFAGVGHFARSRGYVKR